MNHHTVLPLLYSLTPGMFLSIERTLYPEIQALISYRDLQPPSGGNEFQSATLQALLRLGGWTREAALLSITHLPSQPTSCFVLDNYDQEAEALLFPDAFH